MNYCGKAKGKNAFWVLLNQALSDDSITAVAVSLNEACVFDDELPTRLERACSNAAGPADWAVLASTGKCTNGMTASVVYPSAAPRMFSLSIAQPIVDCGLELFILNADFLRDRQSEWQGIAMHPDYFALWCILEGYLEGRVSVFRPEMAIGINGGERGRDHSKCEAMLSTAFSHRLPDETIPSLMSSIPLVAPEIKPDQDTRPKSAREKALARPVEPLSELIRRAVAPACRKMSLSVVTRSRFKRSHLLRRMLSTLTRARQDLDIDLEVVITTDVDADQAQTAHTDLQQEFPELDIVLQCNEGRYPYSRVDNLMGGIMAAGKDYVAIVDDDDFVDLDALKVISSARFLDQDPLLVMSSQVRNETWKETGSKRWILESSTPVKTYYSDNIRYMFKGSNQLPVCALIAPRSWIQERLRDIPLRHDLSEDYTIYLALLCAPDLPPMLIYEDVFCMISARTDDSNTITMTDRRPWVRDITLFLHDLFVTNAISGSGSARMQMQSAVPHTTTSPNSGGHGESQKTLRQGREVALLKAENEHLRSLLACDQTDT